MCGGEMDFVSSLCVAAIRWLLGFLLCLATVWLMASFKSFSGSITMYSKLPNDLRGGARICINRGGITSPLLISFIWDWKKLKWRIPELFTPTSKPASAPPSWRPGSWGSGIQETWNVGGSDVGRHALCGCQCELFFYVRFVVEQKISMNFVCFVRVNFFFNFVCFRRASSWLFVLYIKIPANLFMFC